MGLCKFLFSRKKNSYICGVYMRSLTIFSNEHPHVIVSTFNVVNNLLHASWDYKEPCLSSLIKNNKTQP